MATTRLDGFAAWEAGAEPGLLVTRPFRCSGHRLSVNVAPQAAPQNGSLSVEVLDEQGAPIEGFKSRPITTDTIAHPRDGWVQWPAATDFRRLQGRTICLRFTLQNAALYSFRFGDATTMNLPTPRATTR
jgi:hypothetical protein